MNTGLRTPAPPKMYQLPVPPGVQDNPAIMEYLNRARREVTPNEIVPEELQNRLMAIDDAMTNAYFEIGDIANELAENAPQVTTDNRRKLVTAEMVYDAVGFFCHRSHRTVRYYAECAGFYPADVRRQFDMLPFSHFILARSFNPRWREVLEYARDNPTISEAALRDHFAQRIDPEAEERAEFYSEHDGLEDIVTAELEKAASHEDDNRGFEQVVSGYSALPIKTRGVNALLLSKLSSLSDSLEHMRRVVGDDNYRVRIESIVNDVRDLIQDVQKDVVNHVL